MILKKRIWILTLILVFNFKNFQVTAFALCSNMKITRSSRIIMAGNATTNRLVNKISWSLQLLNMFAYQNDSLVVKALYYKLEGQVIFFQFS
jgi:hypothetical protein